MEQKFTHLHVHSHYSLLDGLSKIPELLDYVKELGMDAAAITDHGVLYGLVEFYKEAKKRGIKPIFGMEAYVALDSRFDKRPGVDDKRYHLTLIAKNEEGYKNLIKLSTKAHLEGFYYKPRVDKALLKECRGGLIALSGCLNGELAKLALARNLDGARQVIRQYQDIFGKENYYLELQCHKNIPEQQKANDALVALGKELNAPLVATQDSHYLKKEDWEAQDILLAIQTGNKISDEQRLTMKDDDFSLKSPEQMAEEFKDTPEAIENTRKIADACDVQIALGQYHLPQFPVPQGYDDHAYLTKLCAKGLRGRYGIQMPQNTKSEILTTKPTPNPNDQNIETILQRLEYELGVIQQTGFSSYFLIVQDFVNWAKQNGIVVGPGRGSAAGSLVAYLLNVTNIDPLKYGLLFERFLNPERVSMPDIDLDFTDTRRDEVIEYVAQKYGRDHVAQIITFGTMAARVAIRDVGRVLDYEYGYCDKLAKMIPMHFTLGQALAEVEELKQFYAQDQRAKKLIDLAKQLEGVVRHASTHACGVVISAQPLEETVPLQLPTQVKSEGTAKTMITQYEMHAVDDLGLLKMDFLGLKNLTILEHAFDSIEKRYGVKLSMDTIPLDDEKTLALLREANTTGLFQLECLTGDTRISNTTVEKLYQQKNKTGMRSVYLGDGTIHNNEIVDIVKSGKKKIHMIIAENNRAIKASPEHMFMTQNGWKKLSELNRGEDQLMYKPKAKYISLHSCSRCGKERAIISGNLARHHGYCYQCSGKIFSNPSKPISKKHIAESRMRFYRNGGKPWNFNLTKDTNAILAETGKKISRALSGITLDMKYGHEKAEILRKSASARFAGTGNPMYGKKTPHRRGGFRKDLGHYVRSNWEADFARILKLYKTPYEYEPRTFTLRRASGELVSYTPDFYTPDDNTFYEVKGWMHDLDAEKIELFQKQYSEYGFVLIDTTRFAELAMKYKQLVAWECPIIPNQLKFIEIKEIRAIGEEETYDIIMKAPGNNFIANSFVVHNSSGMKRYLKELEPSSLEDIIAMVALYRPGPIELIPDFIARKHGQKKITYLHPALEPILRNTYGIAVYQEQVLQIARDVAGFSFGEADVLRKAIGKKIGELLEEQRVKFIEGVKKNGISEKIGDQLFRFIEPFAHYGFNRSHAACYATIAFQTGYLKAHYPTEFMAALLNAEQKNIDRISFLIDECKRMDIRVLPPDINESDETFTVVGEHNDSNKRIRFGLAAIKNVGQNVVNEIIRERNGAGHYASMENFLERMNTKDLNKKSIESLVKAGVFDSLGERNQFVQNMELLLKFNRDKRTAAASNQMSLFGPATAGPKLRLPPPVAAGPKNEALAWEKELLGLYISSHPLEERAEILKMFPKIKNISSKDAGRMMNLAGMLSGAKKIITKSGKPMLFIQLEDLTGKIEAIVFPSLLESHASFFQDGKTVRISGRVSDKDGDAKFICEDVKEL